MSQSREPEAFFPRGAIAAFVLMIAVYVVCWFALYLLMAARA